MWVRCWRLRKSIPVGKQPQDPRLPAVAVVVVSWNGREVTAECVRSLLASEGVRFAIIVVDNASTDGSAESLAETFPQVTVLRNATNLGYTGGGNAGLRHAMEMGAAYAFLINNDTVVTEACLKGLVEAAQRDPRVAAINPKIYYWMHRDRFWYAGGAFSLRSGIPVHRGRKRTDRGQYDVAQNVSFATGCAVLLKLEALEKVGLLDESLVSYAEDVDLSIRLLKAGYILRYEPVGGVWHRDGYSSRQCQWTGHRNRAYARNCLRVVDKHANLLQRVTARILFSGHVLLLVTMPALLRRDLSAARAAVWGLLEGLAGKVGAQTGQERTSS